MSQFDQIRQKISWIPWRVVIKTSHNQPISGFRMNIPLVDHKHSCSFHLFLVQISPNITIIFAKVLLWPYGLFERILLSIKSSIKYWYQDNIKSNSSSNLCNICMGGVNLWLVESLIIAHFYIIQMHCALIIDNQLFLY